MYVDGGSASEIMYEHFLADSIRKLKKQLIPATTPLIVFSGEIIWSIGQIQLLVKIGDVEHSALAWMNFMVVRSQSPYNEIIRRPRVRKLQAVSSTAHGMLKISVEGGVITLKSSKLVPLKCAMVFGPGETPSAAKPIIEERVKVAINPKYPEQTIMIGSTLTEGGRNKLCGLLRRNLDIFAWKPADMTGVPRHIVKHRLNVREGCSRVRQKKRGQAGDKNLAIQEEVRKLVGAGIIREDGYPLPEIDWKVESLCIFLFKCFLDAYKGYHQIQMETEDEDKTAFITSHEIFCYTKMPFGLRNAGATYQHLVDKAFHKHIGKNLQVYVDDLVIKSRTENEIVKDVEETFKTPREINMKLNPKKCAFGVEEGMFLGALRGPELNYTSTKKLVLALVHSSKCLKRPRVSVKGQILADFVVERPEEDSPDTPMEEGGELPEPWILFTDGSSCTDGFRARLILTNPKGMEFIYAIRFRFDATNNEAEYEALIAGLRIAEQMGVKNLQANVDSRLVANQVNETYVAKEADMIHYLKKWGIDRAGPFPEGPKKVKFLIVAMDYFTKWIEAKPVVTITGNQIKKFVWDNIVCRFGLPGKIISDNGKQFRDDPFKDWCEKLCIRQHFASFKHPQTNGLVERANRSLREGIKASNEDTPFSLTYGTKAVIPVEIGMPALRTTEVDLVGNNEALEINLDLLEEIREKAAIREAKSKSKIEKYYNLKVRNTSFKPEDLVYHNNDASRVEETGKLGPKWEGPYEVTEAHGKGAYKLRDCDGKQLLRTWNISNLKKCHIHKMQAIYPCRLRSGGNAFQSILLRHCNVFFLKL
nr:reverse transcriptase domain-containing protein [Tanacetum cinerariifolium]